MSTDDDFLQTIARKLITLGANLAEQVHDRATATPDSDLTRATIDFERASRTTRRGILLARRLAEPVRAPRTAIRKQIIRAVEDSIQRDVLDEDEADALTAEFLDRLDAPDLEEELDESRPPEAIIKDIIRDLGLAHMPGTHPWKRRTPADTAELHARAAAPAPQPAATRKPMTQVWPPASSTPSERPSQQAAPVHPTG